MPAEQKPYAVLPLLEFRQFAVTLVMAYDTTADEFSRKKMESLLNQFSDLQKLETVLWKVTDAPTAK